MDLTQVRQRDWLGLNTAARRNALAAAAQAVRRVEERAGVERWLTSSERADLRRAL
ncbi:MAG: hypothetical protein LC789_06480 [Actinobacteria bacterium]|nr:hypothetical protein [Actinomycetota bacterium]MCA1720431.1 hypothetical protein [Actinomycetota bacterium]